MTKKYLCAILALPYTLVCLANEITIIDNGTPKCHIVVAEGTPPSAEFGAAEIARCFKKYTGAEIAISKAGEKSENGAGIPIVIAIDTKLPKEGFTIDITPEKVAILGSDARGVLYGSYELLKRWGGMRWLVPGEDGEYCVLKGKTIALPRKRISASPSLVVRTFNSMRDEDFLWAARNNMQSIVTWRTFGAPGGAKMRHLEEMAVYGRGMTGHCFSRLMCNYSDDPKKLFAEHPEYFCLVKGARKMSGLAGYGPNPCMSNPAVLERIANTIVRIANEPHGNEAPITIGNDDSMQWCECENCTALDPKETASIARGKRSDRYWWTINEIARRVWAKKPDVQLGGWAYQDFWLPPARIKPDKRLSLTISYNNQCWRHSMGDKTCQENIEMARIYDMWKPFGLKNIINRNEFTCEGCPGGTFIPVAHIVAENMRISKDFGCNGHTWAANGPFPDPLPWEAKNPKMYPPYNGKNLKWFACWQAMYAIALQGWDTSRDISGDLEEANKLYYGAAWEGGMKKFRAILKKAFLGTPNCIRWPNQSAIGPLLDFPGAEVVLSDALKDALAAAADDPRALKHVKDIEYIFECTWKCENQKRRKSYIETDILKLRHPLKGNGAMDQKDIAQSVSITGFTDESTGKAVDAAHATFLRGAYNADGVTFSITALSPKQGEVIELSLTRPDITSMTATAKIKLNSKHRAYALASVTIPSKDLGASIFDGTILELNVVRMRGSLRESLKRFLRCRPERAISSSFQRTQPVWQNGSFDALNPKELPIGWSCPKTGAASHLHSGSLSNRYLHLGEGTSECGQSYNLPTAEKRKYRIVARVRGTGFVRFWVASYHRVGGITGYNAIIDGTSKSKKINLTADWQTQSFETESTGMKEESLSVRFFRGDNSEFDIDDCFVVPLEK